MAADLSLLEGNFRKLVDDLLRACVAAGVQMRPNQGLRDPYVQARLWRQSRSIEEIAAAIDKLKQSNAPFLAECLESVGPQHGSLVTNALPGLSWHQWGEALDCFWVVDAKAEWSTTRKVNGTNGYRVYAEKASAIGLTAGGYWPKLKDWGHVQLRAAATPLATMSLIQIDQAMSERFGH